MNWLSLVVAAAKFFTVLLNTIREWTIAAAGEIRGRAASEAEHAAAAKKAGDAMDAIARQPASRTEIEKKLEEGSA